MKIRNAHSFSGRNFGEVSKPIFFAALLAGLVIVSPSNPVQAQTATIAQVPVSAANPASASASTPSLAPATAPALNSVPAIATDNLETGLRELHESLRRMTGDIDDILHEVTRTQEVFDNGAPVSATTAITNAPAFNMMGGMSMMDATTHDVYMKPRPHWLNNSMSQLLDLQPTVQGETVIISKILSLPACNSATRAQGFVLGDISGDLAKDLAGLQAVLHEEPLVNGKIAVMAKKVQTTIAGMYSVADRVWKEAPRSMKGK